MERPLNAAFRRSGDVDAGDLVVGAVDGAAVVPRARVRQGTPAMATIELTSASPLRDVTAVLQMTPAGTARPVSEQPMVMRTRSNDRTIVMAQTKLDLVRLAPGTYTASAVLSRGSSAFLRVSRVVDVEAGSSETVTPVTSPADAPTANAPPAGAADDLLARAGRYAAGWGEQAALIIGVEHYEQREPRAPLGEPSERRLVAEIALLKANDAIGWIAYRDVMEVDGKAVGDRRNRLEGLLLSGTPDVAEARRIADEGARFNIGPVRRNFNEPTAALFFMLPLNQRRFAFSRKGPERIGGVEAARFDFRETAKPTLIRTGDGHDVASQGSVWILPDGTIARTRLIVGGFTGFESRSEVDVTFARDPRLALWLPARMTERHQGSTRMATRQGIRLATRQSEVTATATYDGYKRFETSAIIK